METQAFQQWNTTTLGKIADVRDGTHDTPKKQTSGKSLITSKQLKNGTILPTDYFITEEDFEFVNKRSKVDKNDVLISMIGTVGDTVFIKDQPDFAIKNIGLIKNKDSITGRFIFYWLNSPVGKHEIDKRLRGTSQRFISLGSLRELDITLPDHPTQKQIADVLSTFDNLIENNTRRIQILEQSAQAIYTEWFVNFHFPDHEKVKMTDSGTDFGKIPQEWIVKKLGEKIDISRGKNITKKTIEKGSVPVVAGGLEPAYYHSTANTEAPVVTVSASGANAGFINLYMENVWASDCSYIDKGITPFVLYYFLLLKSRQVEVTGLQRGSAQPHVYPKDLSELLVVDVPDHLLENFEGIVSTIFSFVGNLKKQNKALRDNRDLLLPKIVTGEIKI